MANTLVNVNVQQIAQRSIDYLGLTFLPVKSFATDFSDDIKSEGESVKTRIPGAVSVTNLSNGYTASDVSNTGVDVSLDQFWGPVMQFSDEEASKAGDVNWLRDNFIEPAKEALLDKFLQTMFDLVLAANYSNSLVKVAADFDADVMADLSTDLSTLKVPEPNRVAILPPSHHGALIKDSVIEDMSAFGDNEAIKKAQVREARGFRIFKYANIPDKGENLLGFVAHRSAMAFAARQVADPTQLDGTAPLGVENVTDPVTGIPLQVRAWYDPNAGKYKFSMGTLWGVAKAQGNSLKRITSA